MNALTGICKHCGRSGTFTWIGADIYRCSRCKKTILEEEIIDEARTLPGEPVGESHFLFE